MSLMLKVATFNQVSLGRCSSACASQREQLSLVVPPIISSVERNRKSVATAQRYSHCYSLSGTVVGQKNCVNMAMLIILALLISADQVNFELPNCESHAGTSTVV